MFEFIALNIKIFTYIPSINNSEQQLCCEKRKFIRKHFISLQSLTHNQYYETVAVTVLIREHNKSCPSDTIDISQFAKQILNAALEI